MKNDRLPVLSVILCTLAGLLAVYSVWAFVSCIGTISDLISSNQVTFGEDSFNIITYFMQNSIQYVVFAVILFTLGWNRMDAIAPDPDELTAETTNDSWDEDDDSEDDFDDDDDKDEDDEQEV